MNGNGNSAIVKKCSSNFKKPFPVPVLVHNKLGHDQDQNNKPLQLLSFLCQHCQQRFSKPRDFLLHKRREHSREIREVVIQRNRNYRMSMKNMNSAKHHVVTDNDHLRQGQDQRNGTCTATGAKTLINHATETSSFQCQYCQQRFNWRCYHRFHESKCGQAKRIMKLNQVDPNHGHGQGQGQGQNSNQNRKAHHQPSQKQKLMKLPKENLTSIQVPFNKSEYSDSSHSHKFL